MSRWIAAVCLLALVVPVLAIGSDVPLPQSVLEEEWSLRLMQEQARIDHARKRLDEANAAFARAVARAVTKGEDDLVVASFESRRKSAAVELKEAEAALPRLVQDARAGGVGEEVLRPYRFAVSPGVNP